MPKFTFQWNSVPKLTLGSEVHRLVPKLFRAELTRAEHRLPQLSPNGCGKLVVQHRVLTFRNRERTGWNRGRRVRTEHKRFDNEGEKFGNEIVWYGIADERKA